MTKESVIVVRCYTTRGTKKKLLSHSILASRSKYAMKKRKKVITIVEDDIPEDKVVIVEEEKEVD